MTKDESLEMLTQLRRLGLTIATISMGLVIVTVYLSAAENGSGLIISDEDLGTGFNNPEPKKSGLNKKVTVEEPSVFGPSAEDLARRGKPSCRLYSNWNYSGSVITMIGGERIYSFVSHNFNDVASSVRVDPGCTLHTWKHSGFGRPKTTYRSNKPRFNKQYYLGNKENDSASSAHCDCSNVVVQPVKPPPPKFAVTMQVECASTNGTGRRYDTGFSIKSCAQARQRALGHANKNGCKTLGSNWNIVFIKQIETVSCRLP